MDAELAGADALASLALATSENEIVEELKKLAQMANTVRAGQWLLKDVEEMLNRGGLSALEATEISQHICRDCEMHEAYDVFNLLGAEINVAELGHYGSADKCRAQLVVELSKWSEFRKSAV